MSRRCAIYARYSSDLQRETSIEDQLRRCREYARGREWPIIEDWVVADRAVSAASIAGRDGLQRLVGAAKVKPRPFDCLLVDDTSRLARDLSDALRTLKILEFYGVTIVSVSQGIDSAQGNARPLLAMHGIMDEEYLAGLAAKVHRGQEGRVLHGYTTGGRVYGYTNVPIEDPTRTGKYGRPAVSGVKLAIHCEQAAVVGRIFEMYANGMGLRGIAVQLNGEGVPGPNGLWSRYTIHEMLRNERYRGVSVWGRTKKGRNPETGGKVSRAVPQANWRRVDVPEWRIVSEPLWQSVHARRQQTEANFHKHGGMSRTERGRRYLFSGNLVCGLCGGSIVICAGGGKRGYVKYGCHAHKHNGACENKLMIRQDRLEEQLLAAIEQRILDQRAIESTITRCAEALRRRMAKMEQQGELSTVESLKESLEDRARRQGKIIEAIETAGNVGRLADRLRELEREIEEIRTSISSCRPMNVEKSLAELRSLVTQTVSTLRESLANRGEGDMVRAKKALSEHIGRLVLTPAARDGRPVYQVSGGLTLAPPDGQKCRMQLVARDGIEPPTPAFSGLDSSIAKSLKSRKLKHPVGFISLLFWDSNGTEEWDNNSGRSNLPSLSSIPFPIAVPSSLGNPEDKPHSQVVGNRFMEAQARVKAGANAKI